MPDTTFLCSHCGTNQITGHAIETAAAAPGDKDHNPAGSDIGSVPSPVKKHPLYWIGAGVGILITVILTLAIGRKMRTTRDHASAVTVAQGTKTSDQSLLEVFQETQPKPDNKEFADTVSVLLEYAKETPPAATDREFAQSVDGLPPTASQQAREEMEGRSREAPGSNAPPGSSTGAESDVAVTNAEILIKMGLAYYQNADCSNAASCFRKAADTGNAVAQYNLGVCYMEGIGVSPNPVEAVHWYKLAGKRGLAAAQVKLGVCYYTGNGVQRNYGFAEQCFRLAAEQGNQTAQRLLNALLEEMANTARQQQASQQSAAKTYERPVPRAPSQNSSGLRPSPVNIRRVGEEGANIRKIGE